MMSAPAAAPPPVAAGVPAASRARRGALHRVLLKVHLWIGLAAGLPILALAVTGCLLSFEESIDRALSPGLRVVVPGPSRVSLQSMVDAVRTAYPRETPLEVRVPGNPAAAATVILKSRRLVFIDPYSGAIKGDRSVFASLTVKIGQIHTGHVGGRWGRTAAVAFTLVALLGAVTGLYLWWPRRIVTVKWGRVSWRRTNFDLHSVIGFFSSAVLVVTLLSAIALAYEHDVLEPLAARLEGGSGRVERPQSRPSPGARRLTLDEAEAVAARLLPGTSHVAVNVPQDPAAPYVARRRYPEDKTGGGRTVVYMDQYSGEALRLDDARAQGLASRAVHFLSPVHTGKVLGWPTVLLAFLGTAALAGQVVTGFLIWWKP